MHARVFVVAVTAVVTTSGWLTCTSALVATPAMRHRTGLFDASFDALMGKSLCWDIKCSSSSSSSGGGGSSSSGVLGHAKHRYHHQRSMRSPCRCFMMPDDVPIGKGKFVKLGGTEDAQRFGPRCILASGISLEERSVIRAILDDDDQEQEGTPLVVSTQEIADKRVGDVLTDAPMISLLQAKQDACPDSVAAELSTPVILISGFTNTELRKFASRFRSETEVRAAFAKAVPNAMTKSVARLCGEIAQDHADALAGKLHGGES